MGAAVTSIILDVVVLLFIFMIEYTHVLATETPIIGM